MADDEPGVQIASSAGKPEAPMTIDEVLELQRSLRHQGRQQPQFYPSGDNPLQYYMRRPTTRERMQRAKEWRDQENDDPNFEKPQHWDPGKSPPRAETPGLKGLVEGELGAAREREPEFVRNALGMVTGPYQAAKSVLTRGAQGKIGSESVTGAESMALPGYLAGQYPRAAAGGLGVAGGALKEIQLHIRDIRGQIANLERSAKQLENTHKLMEWDDPMRPHVLRFLNSARDNIAGLKSTLEDTIRTARQRHGSDFDWGKPTTDLGVAGGQGGRTSSRSRQNLIRHQGVALGTANPQEVTRMWRAIDKYPGDIGRQAEELNISENVLRARLRGGPLWARPQSNDELVMRFRNMPSVGMKSQRSPNQDLAKAYEQLSSAGLNPDVIRRSLLKEFPGSDEIIEGFIRRKGGPVKAGGVPAPTQDQRSIDWFYGSET